MSDWREERPGEAGERWKTGPLGDEGDEETRRIPRQERSGPERPGNDGEDQTRRIRRESSGPLGWDEEPETRAVRPRRNRPSPSRESREGSGTQEWALPQQPVERTRDVDMSREDRLRDLYGGVDWLASFLGTIFTAVAGTAMFFIAGIAVLAPLQLFPALRAGELTANVYTGLAVVAVILFLGYFVGGYVSGRLARFDGGRNGLMVILWTLVFAALVVVTGGVLANFITGSFFEVLQSRVLQANEILTSSFDQLGAVGIAIAAGVVLVSALGAFLGGRLGERYHTDIDHAA